MRSFSIQYKPESDGPFLPPAIEYVNAIDKSMADELISIAINHDGWHRRGSKSKSIDASFTTTLIHDLNHKIYDIMDEFWKQATEFYKIKLDFVEVYELKEYKIGDKFGLHTDTHEKIDVLKDRKLNFVLQLSDAESYRGGDLIVKDFVATREIGSIIFFPANYQHEVTLVTEGTRYSLIGHGWGDVYRR